MDLRELVRLESEGNERVVVGELAEVRSAATVRRCGAPWATWSTTPSCTVPPDSRSTSTCGGTAIVRGSSCATRPGAARRHSRPDLRALPRGGQPRAPRIGSRAPDRRDDRAQARRDGQRRRRGVHAGAADSRSSSAAGTPRGSTMTGHCAWAATRLDTPPSSTAFSGPYPREPMTSRSRFPETVLRTSRLAEERLGLDRDVASELGDLAAQRCLRLDAVLALDVRHGLGQAHPSSRFRLRIPPRADLQDGDRP